MSPDSVLLDRRKIDWESELGLELAELVELLDATPDELTAALERTQDFVRFSKRIPTAQGDAFDLDKETFQKLILLCHFLGFTEVFTIIPKGNGKTTLLALLMVYHLLTVKIPEVVAGAATVAQAGKIYREACRIAAVPSKRNNNEPTPWHVPDEELGVRKVLLRNLSGTREIRLGKRPEDGNMLVLASDRIDQGTLEGIGPTLGVCEELHAHLSEAIYDAIQGALHKRPGYMFGISTAGRRLASLLGRVRGNALAKGVVTSVPKFGHLRVARIGRDFIMFEWAVPEGADIEDMDVVKGANPMSNVTPEKLRKLRASPGMTLARWKRNHCGQWTSEDAGWLEGRADWDKNGRRSMLTKGDEIYLGTDPAWSYDSLAIVALKVIGDPIDRRFYSEPIAILSPKKLGQTVSPRQVETALLQAMSDYRVIAMGWDKNRGFKHIVEKLANEHSLTTVVVPMSGNVWVPLTSELQTAIADGDWLHGEDDEYTSHVLSGELLATPAGERLHGRTDHPVDGLMATGIAHFAAFGVSPDISIYQTRGGGL